jgi:hypothetical protein
VRSERTLPATPHKFHEVRQTKKKSEGECLCSLSGIVEEESSSDFATQRLERKFYGMCFDDVDRKTEYMRI